MNNLLFSIYCENPVFVSMCKYGLYFSKGSTVISLLVKWVFAYIFHFAVSVSPLQMDAYFALL